ncbi:MAG: hypothetical protein U9Q70_03895 [Chloroflexota bacterium]|nr:hypothetical protein [Chloroflexota bacterium]
MHVNKFIFPLILLVIFLGIIILSMVVGYWETQASGVSGHAPVTLTSEISWLNNHTESCYD